MSRLAPFTGLVLAAVQEIHRKHAIAGWYDVRYLIKWLQSKRKPELNALYDAYQGEPDPKQAAQAEIEAYLPNLNQKKMGTIPVEPKGSVVMWKVSPKTAPPNEAPAPPAEKPPAERPRRVRGQPWVALIDRGDLEGLRRWLDEGGDPNAAGRAEGEAPLDYAAGAGEVEMVRLLLDHGARGHKPLLESVCNFRGAVARVLLESGVWSREDLLDARATVRDLVDDPELEQLLNREVRRRRK
jgi:hypothetical protein